VLHCGLVAIYIEKYVTKAKEEEELWKLKLFSPCKNIISRKTLSKKKPKCFNIL
jgi:hypothetical protein